MGEESKRKAAELSDEDLCRVAGGENDNTIASITVDGVKVCCERNSAMFGTYYYQGAANDCPGFMLRSDLNTLSGHSCEACQCFSPGAGYVWRYVGSPAGGMKMQCW